MQLQSLALAPAPAPVVGFDAESDEELKIVGAIKTYGRDEEVFAEGDRADFVYRVVSGAVRMTRVLADGRRQVADFYLPGDVFGVELGAERTATAEAVGEVMLVVARRAVLASDPAQAQKLWRQALGELGRCRDHLLTVTHRSATERVARFLLDLGVRLGGEAQIDLPMSRQDIADYLGLTIETVSRTMTQLQADGLVRLSGCRQVTFARPAALAGLCE
ncbi:MAG: helix-turn-helix domain-containing protein [Caulobacteraceae bacterium]|nr:helix-turn-helix domain-containing protein [Caulobacteraceae bacterium]